jgi:uncharacterized small protein (DUF1192 family)
MNAWTTAATTAKAWARNRASTSDRVRHRGQPHDQLDEAADVPDVPDRIATLEREIGDLERLRAQLTRDEVSPDLESTDRWGDSYGPGYTRSDDSSRGR